MTRPVTFRVYPRRSRSGLYVLVRVFGTQRDLVRTIRAENRRGGVGDVTESDVQGLMQTRRTWAGPRMRLLPSIGVVNLIGLPPVPDPRCHAWRESYAGGATVEKR